jgi:hypothetical protein
MPPDPVFTMSQPKSRRRKSSTASASGANAHAREIRTTPPKRKGQGVSPGPPAMIHERLRQVQVAQTLALGHRQVILEAGEEGLDAKSADRVPVRIVAL